MAISTKPGGKYDTENGQYVSDGSSDDGQSKNQEPTKMQKIGEALKGYGIAISTNLKFVTESINKNPQKAQEIFSDAIKSGKINLKLREQKQMEHIEGTLQYKQALEHGKEPSILNEDANKLIKLYAGKGKLLFVKGKWAQTERFKHDAVIGVFINKQKGKRYNTQYGRIHYSNKGAHIVPDGKDRKK